jgi:flavorubredoxin
MPITKWRFTIDCGGPSHGLVGGFHPKSIFVLYGKWPATRASPAIGSDLPLQPQVRNTERMMEVVAQCIKVEDVPVFIFTSAKHRSASLPYCGSTRVMVGAPTYEAASSLKGHMDEDGFTKAH